MDEKQVNTPSSVEEEVTTTSSPTSEKEASKKSNKNAIIHAIKMLFCILLVEFLCFPALMLAIDGSDETKLENEAYTKLESFSIKGYLDGTFQQNFNSWFSNHYPLRSEVVKTYNSLVSKYNYLSNKNNPEVEQPELDTKDVEITTDKEGNEIVVFPGIKETSTSHAFETGMSESGQETNGPERETTYEEFIQDLEHNIYANINIWQLQQRQIEPTVYLENAGVIVGKSGYLFESAYIFDYLGYAAPYNSYDPANLQTTVEKLTYIQDQLNKRGIGFVYVISSSKASQYADYIPDWFKAHYKTPDGYVRAYDALIPMLEKSRLNYVDSKQLFEEKGLIVTFPKTGIHWNKLAAFEANRRAIELLEKQMNNTAPHMTFETFAAQSKIFGYGNSETDVFGIINSQVPGTATITDRYYFAPNVHLTADSKPEDRKNILIQGGSFTHDFVHYCRNYIGGVRQIYYSFNSYNDWIGGAPNMNPLAHNNSEEWEYLLKDIDYCIFEATEQQLATIGWGSFAGHWNVYNSLYEYLQNHEIAD